MSVSGIELTEIDVQTVSDDQAPLLGFCRVALNGVFVISGIRIVNGREGIFISFPREHNKKTGKKIGVCYPISKSLTAMMTEKILAAYTNAKGGEARGNPIQSNIIRQEY